LLQILFGYTFEKLKLRVLRLLITNLKLTTENRFSR